MRQLSFSTLVLLGLTTLLMGCQNNTQRQAAVQRQAQESQSSVNVATVTTDQPQIATTQPQLNKAQVAKIMPTPEAGRSSDPSKGNKPPVVDIWQPNEAQLARGHELILGLRSEFNREPTVHEMEKRLQTHMGLTPTQAQKIIATLRQARDRH